MKIGPVDIRNHSFARRAMRGLDEAEVRAYLDLIADRLEESILEAEDLRSRIDRLDSQLSSFHELEKTLRDSLLSAERLSDERLAQAEKEARIVLKDAEVEGTKMLAGARAEEGRLRAALDDLRRQRATYVERFRALLRSQMKILEASLETFDPESSDAEAGHVLDAIDPPGTADSTPAAPTTPRAWAPARPTPPAPAETPTSYLGEAGLFSSLRAPEGEPRREDG